MPHIQAINGVDCLVFNQDEPIKHKKLSGHTFVDLIELNPYQKYQGDVILQLFGLVKPDVDPKYLRRGDFAESIVRSVYTRDGHQVQVYDKKAVNYDNFQDNPYFGGLIDIELPQEQTIIEVKSKSIKDYDKIFYNQPLAEYWQGLYYTVLRGYKKLIMEWIFFDETTEQQIFAGQTPSSLTGLKRITKEYEITPITLTRVSEEMQRALQIYERCYSHRAIPLSWISPQVLKLVLN